MMSETEKSGLQGAVTRRQLLATGSAGCAAFVLTGAARASQLDPRPMHAAPHADIGEMSAQSLRAAYARRSLSPVEVAKALLARIDATQGSVNAFAFTRPEDTLAQAFASERRWQRGKPLGRLDGIPISVKDYDYRIAGWPMTMGSLLYRGDAAVAQADSPDVANLRRLGAVFTGVTTVPDTGFCNCSTSPRYGATRNPWNLSRTTGASSSGAAAAAAAGLGPIHLGSDGGGSIRTPAAWCGVVGVKPPPRSNFGPITRSVADAALLLSDYARAPTPEPEESEGQLYPVEDYLAGLEDYALAGRRVAFWPHVGGDAWKMRPEIEAVVRAALNKIAGQENIDIDEIPPLIEPGALRAGMAWGMGPWLKGRLDALSPDQRGLVDWNIREMYRGATAMTDADAEALERAWNAGSGRLMNRPNVLDGYDLILTPAHVIPPFSAEARYPDGYNPSLTPFGVDDGSMVTMQLAVFNLLEYPAAVVPCGFDSDGLPVGLQVAVSSARPNAMRTTLCAAARLAQIVSPIKRYPFQV